MRITSNIKGVIGRLERLQKGIPQAFERAVAPAYWLPRLQASAEKTLRALWALERSVALRKVYEKLTPRIVESITAEVFGGGALFTARIPAEMTGAGLGGDIAKASQFNLEKRTPGGKESKNFRLPVEQLAANAENLQRVREGILEWVRLEKIKDERDAGLSDEQIAERLEWILGLNKRSSPKEYTAAMQEAGGRLAARIQEFLNIDAEGGVTRLEQKPTAMDPETATEWMTAVMATWRALLKVSLPAKVQYELDKEFRKAATELF